MMTGGGVHFLIFSIFPPHSVVIKRTTTLAAIRYAAWGVDPQGGITAMKNWCIFPADRRRSQKENICLKGEKDD
jgi:hypothetical protein